MGGAGAFGTFPPYPPFTSDYVWGPIKGGLRGEAPLLISKSTTTKISNQSLSLG